MDAPNATRKKNNQEEPAAGDQIESGWEEYSRRSGWTGQQTVGHGKIKNVACTVPTEIAVDPARR